MSACLLMALRLNASFSSIPIILPNRSASDTSSNLLNVQETTATINLSLSQGRLLASDLERSSLGNCLAVALGLSALGLSA